MTKISEQENTASRQEYIRNFSKRMLKTHLFVGSFQEKRFVEPLNSYRDVVLIDPEEQEFIENVMAVKRKLGEQLNYPSQNPLWIGITDPDTVGAPVGHSLWVVLPIEIFGKYWFKVRSVAFLSNEVQVKLDVVRPVKHEMSDVSSTEANQSFDLGTTVQNVSNNLKNNLLNLHKEYVTLANIKQSVIFIFLLIGTIIAGGANIITYFMEYFLRLIGELSGFVKACTPITISFINVLGKLIYGLYALIVALFHGKPVQQPPVHNSHYYVDPDQMLQFRDPRQRYNQYFNNRALPYSNSSVKITPLDN